MLIYCVHLFSDNTCLLDIVLLSNKQVSYSSKIIFVPLQHLSSYFMSIFLNTYILALYATNPVMSFPPSLPFIMPTTLFFLDGSGLLSSFEYLLSSNPASASLAIIFVNFLTHKKAVCPYSVVLHYFHTYWTSYINILLKSNITCERYAGLFTGLFILTNSNNSFENGHPSLKFDFITYLAYFPWFVFVAPNIFHGLSKNPVLHELKKSLSSTHSSHLFLIWYLAWLKTSSNSFVQI